MQQLSYIGLLKVIRRCATEPGFKGAIFVEAEKKVKSMFDDVLDIIESDPEEEAAMTGHTVSTSQIAIAFKDESALWIIAASNVDRLKGYSFDEIHYYETIASNDYVREKIALLEREESV